MKNERQTECAREEKDVRTTPTAHANRLARPAPGIGMPPLMVMPRCGAVGSSTRPPRSPPARI